MNFEEIKTEVIKILKESEGDYLFPYQIFKKIENRNLELSKKLRDEYPVELGNPIMGEGAGIKYSVATFIAKAMSKFKETEPRIVNAWFDPSDINIDGIVPGNKETVSIWAWKE